MSDIKESINALKKAFDVEKDSELTDILKISYSAIDAWKRRGKLPSKYEKYIQMQGRVNRPSHESKTSKEKLTTKIETNNYTIDLLSVRAGAGEGIYNYVIETVDTISLDKSFFRTPINTNKVKGIQVDGDSMEPTLRDGDFVLIDESTNFGTNGIYAIQYDGKILIKRLQFKMDGSIIIISDNEKYEKEIFNPSETQLPFQVLGLKVLSIQR